MIKVKQKTTVKDMGFTRVMREIGKLADKPFVKVGILQAAGAHRSAGLTVAEVGITNEYGLPSRRIPERSFMRSTVDENAEKWHSMVKRERDQIWLGQSTVFESLAKIGEVIKSAIKDKISTLTEPPNAIFTILRKGSSKPLIDTGQMLNSIHYKIEKKT